MSTGPTSVPGCTQWWSINPAETYNQSPRLAGPASLPGGVGEPFSTQYWPPVNPTAELEYSKQGKSSKANICSIQQTIPLNIELSKKLDSLIDGMNSLKSKVRALQDNKFSQQQQNPRTTHTGATHIHKSSPGQQSQQWRQHRSQQWRPSAPLRQTFKGNCHKCGEAGHKQSDCPLN